MNHDIKIVVTGHCGSGKTVLAYRILELLKADGWDVESEPTQVSPTTFVDEIREQEHRDPVSTNAARAYLRRNVRAKLSEMSINRVGNFL